MSVLTPGAAEGFIVRIWKSLSTNPSVRWANTYECRFSAAGTMADLVSLAVGIADFERRLALQTTVFEYYTLSTWTPDSHPYNPDSFATAVIGTTGAVAFSSGTDLDLRICLRVTREVPTGRIGKLFLRNSLVAGQVNNHAGVYALVDQPATNIAVQDAVNDAALNGNMVDGGLQPILALLGDDEETRFITGFAAAGVSFVKLNHKYFDRS